MNKREKKIEKKKISSGNLTNALASGHEQKNGKTGDIIIYALPIWMRLPANHLLSLAWIIILSAMRGEKQTGQDDKVLTTEQKEDNE